MSIHLCNNAVQMTENKQDTVGHLQILASNSDHVKGCHSDVLLYLHGPLECDIKHSFVVNNMCKPCKHL